MRARPGTQGFCPPVMLNGMYETPLLDAVARKLQEHVLSEEAIEKIVSLYRKRLAARRKAVPVDDGRLQKQIAALNKQIDQGAERVFSAPAGIVGTLYAKLDRLRAERDRLQGQLNAAGQADLNCSAAWMTRRSRKPFACCETCAKSFPRGRTGRDTGVGILVGCQDRTTL